MGAPHRPASRAATPQAVPTQRLSADEARQLLRGTLPPTSIHARLTAALDAADPADNPLLQDLSTGPTLPALTHSSDARPLPPRTPSLITDIVSEDELSEFLGGISFTERAAEGYRIAVESSRELAELVARRGARERELERRKTTVYQLDRYAQMHSQVVAAVERPIPSSGAGTLSPLSRSRRGESSLRGSTSPANGTARVDSDDELEHPTKMTRADVEALFKPNEVGLEDRVLERHRAAKLVDTARYQAPQRQAQKWMEKGVMLESELDHFGDATELLTSKAVVHRVLHERDDATRDYIQAALGQWSSGALFRVDRNDQFETVLTELLETVKDQSRLPLSVLEELLQRLDVGLNDDGKRKMINQLDPKGRGEVAVDALRSYWHKTELSSHKRKVSLEKATEALNLEYPVAPKQRGHTADKKTIPFHAFVGWLTRMGARIDPEDAAPIYATLQPLTRTRALSDPVFTEIQHLVQRIRADQSEATNDLALARRLQEVESRTTEATIAYDNFQAATDNTVGSQRRLETIHGQLKQQAAAAAAMGRLAPIRYFYTIGTNTDVAIDDSFIELWESVIQQVRGGAARSAKGLPNALEMKEQKLQRASQQLKATTNELVAAKSQLEAVSAKHRTLQRLHEAEKDVRDTQIEVLTDRVNQLSEGPGVVFADPRFGVEVAEEVRVAMVTLKTKLRSQVVDHTQAMQQALREVGMWRNKDEEAQQLIVVLKHRLEKIKSDMTGEITVLEEQLRARDDVASKLKADISDHELRYANIEGKLQDTQKELAAMTAKCTAYQDQVDRLLRMQKTLVAPDEVERRIKVATNAVKLESSSLAKANEALQNDMATIRKELVKEQNKSLEAQSKSETATAQVHVKLTSLVYQRDVAKEAVRAVISAWVDAACHCRSVVQQATEIDDVVSCARNCVKGLFNAAEEALAGLSEAQDALPDLDDLISPLRGLIHEELQRGFDPVRNKYIAEIESLMNSIKDLTEEKSSLVTRLVGSQQDVNKLVNEDRSFMALVHTATSDLDEVYSGIALGSRWDPSCPTNEADFPSVAGPRWTVAVRMLSDAVKRCFAAMTDMKAASDDLQKKLDNAEAASRCFTPPTSLPQQQQLSNTSFGSRYDSMLDPRNYEGEGTQASPMVITAPDAIFSSLHESITIHERATASMLSTLVKALESEQTSSRAHQAMVRSVVHAKIHNAVSRARERVAVRWIERSERHHMIQRARLIMDALATFDADRAENLRIAVADVLSPPPLPSESSDASPEQTHAAAAEAHKRRKVPRPGRLAGIKERLPPIATSVTPAASAALASNRQQSVAVETPKKSKGGKGANSSKASEAGSPRTHGSGREPTSTKPQKAVANHSFALQKSEPATPVLATTTPEQQPPPRNMVLVADTVPLASAAPTPLTPLSRPPTRDFGVQVATNIFSMPMEDSFARRGSVSANVVTVTASSQTDAARQITVMSVSTNTMPQVDRVVSSAQRQASTTDLRDSKRDPGIVVTPNVVDAATTTSASRTPSPFAVVVAGSERSASPVLASGFGSARIVASFRDSPKDDASPSVQSFHQLSASFAIGPSSTSQHASAAQLLRPSSTTSERSAATRPPTGSKRATSAGGRSVALPVPTSAESVPNAATATAVGRTGVARRPNPQPAASANRAQSGQSAGGASSIAAAAAAKLTTLTATRTATPKSTKLRGVRLDETLPPVQVPQVIPAGAAATAKQEDGDTETMDALRAAIKGATARFRLFLHRKLYPLKKITLEIDESAAYEGPHRVIPFEAVEALTNSLPMHLRLPGVRYVLLAMLCGVGREAFTAGVREDHFVPPFYADPMPPDPADIDALYDAAILCGEVLLLGKRIRTRNFGLLREEYLQSGYPADRSRGRSKSPGANGATPRIAHDEALVHHTGPIGRLLTSEEPDAELTAATVLATPNPDQAAAVRAKAASELHRGSSATSFRRPYSATSIGGSSSHSRGPAASPVDVHKPTATLAVRPSTPLEQAPLSDGDTAAETSPITTPTRHSVPDDYLPPTEGFSSVVYLPRATERERVSPQRTAPPLTVTTYSTNAASEASLPRGGARSVARAAAAASSAATRPSTQQSTTQDVLSVMGTVSEQRKILQATRGTLNEVHKITKAT
jgi:hypothetical protein